MIKKTILNHSPIIAIVTLIISCAFIGDKLTLLLRFEREAILSGELYRLLTAHIVHLNWMHALMNVAATIIGWCLLRDSMTNRQWILSIAISGLVVSVLLFSLPELEWYVGFSGIIHGLMLQGLILQKHLRFIEKTLMVSALFLKVFYELWQGSSTADLEFIDGNIIVEAHLFGLLAGLIMIICIKTMAFYRQ